MGAAIVGSQVIIEKERKTLEEWDREPPPNWDQLRQHVVLMLPKHLVEGAHYLDQLMEFSDHV